jgi:hypothetical protein
MTTVRCRTRLDGLARVTRDCPREKAHGRHASLTVCSGPGLLARPGRPDLFRLPWKATDRPDASERAQSTPLQCASEAVRIVRVRQPGRRPARDPNLQHGKQLCLSPPFLPGKDAHVKRIGEAAHPARSGGLPAGTSTAPSAPLSPRNNPSSGCHVRGNP